MVLKVKQFPLKKHNHHHQILPYKRRLKIDTWKITIILIVLLLAAARCSHCSVIVNNNVKNSNELINYDDKDLVQSAKEIYLQSLREVLYSQLRNISAIATIDKVSESTSY